MSVPVRDHHKLQSEVQVFLPAGSVGKGGGVPILLHRFVRGSGQCLALSLLCSGERGRSFSDTICDSAPVDRQASILPEGDHSSFPVVVASRPSIWFLLCSKF
ncbi:hypothetical protein M5D96_014141 [Drosophila gunungcola]|uniref:Uncharacterized protein n=1 Tax=Drosophila gunungcola TaxID=103775 RepID=A0A9P9Y9Y5_9MUSC|nr:hypothetical protein M5D96_014141 [Drosophila gunungcola]